MAKTEVVEYTNDFEDEESSSIEHVWYNANTHRMTVKFKTGGLYSYDDVNRGLFDEFFDSDSLGQFFREHFRRPGHVWPGAKHNERTTVFRQVDPEPVKAETDLDAHKTVRLTAGKGKMFSLRYSYEAESEMEVRAVDAGEAIALFKEYMREKGFKAKVTQVNVKV